MPFKLLGRVEGVRYQKAATCVVSLQCDIPREHLETFKRVTSIDVTDRDYHSRPDVQHKRRIKSGSLYESVCDESGSMRDVSLQCDIARRYLEYAKRVSSVDVVDVDYHETPTIHEKRRIRRNPFHFHDFSKSISSIELTGSRKRKGRLTPLAKKNLFRISEFLDKEVKVDEDTEENSCFEAGQTTESNLSDFVVETEESCNSKPLFCHFQNNSPNVRVGNLDIDELAKKYAASNATSCDHPPKKRRLYISSSSDNDDSQLG